MSQFILYFNLLPIALRSKTKYNEALSIYINLILFLYCDLTNYHISVQLDLVVMALGHLADMALPQMAVMAVTELKVMSLVNVSDLLTDL